jgi:integrase
VAPASSKDSDEFPEQLTLFETGLDLTEVRADREQIMEYRRARATVSTYANRWMAFERWCTDTGRQALPCSSDTVSLYATWGAKHRKPKPYALSSLELTVAAIRDKHIAAKLPVPIDQKVRETMSGLARTVPQESRRLDAVTPTMLRKVIKYLASEGDAQSIRDRAILLLGFTSGWRTEELAELRMSDISISDEAITLHLRRSKTDQEGKGREVRIPRIKGSELCPVAAIELWISDVRGNKPGPLLQPFRGISSQLKPGNKRLDRQQIRYIVKRVMSRAGIKTGRFGAHSLRAGMITAAAENGANVLDISQRTGHRALDTLAKYVRSVGGFKRDPLKGVLK